MKRAFLKTPVELVQETEKGILVKFDNSKTLIVQRENLLLEGSMGSVTINAFKDGRINISASNETTKQTLLFFTAVLLKQVSKEFNTTDKDTLNSIQEALKELSENAK